MADSDIDKLAAAAPVEARKAGFREWAGGDRRMLALVFTDIVDSTKLAVAIGDIEMAKVRDSHFRRSSDLIAAHHGYEIKTIGDSVMATFHVPEEAFGYAKALHQAPGDERLAGRLRAGIHVGVVEIAEADAFGVTVNYAARVIHAIQGPDIAVSGAAHDGLSACFGEEAVKRDWSDGHLVEMKGFPHGRIHLYSPESAFRFPLPK